jgi:predicted AlkP superfamily phosphohydrolase/phosphomutase
MEEGNRVLVIGIDAATWDVLDPWMSDGSLPNLTGLRESGSWGSLRSTIPPLSAPAWASFMTGKNPGKHGIFHFTSQQEEARAAESDSELVNSRSIKSSTLWDILGHHGRKVGIVNLPMTYPPRPVNGFMIAGFLTPPGARVFTYPPDLSDELTDYRIDLDQFISRKPFESTAKSAQAKAAVEPSVDLVHEFHDLMEQRARMSLSLMASEPWDVFMCVFMGTDRLGHYLWPYHRAADLDGSQESLELHRAIHAYYMRLDEFVGQFVEQAGENTTIMVLSDHGMGPYPSKRVHWNHWLRQQKLVSAQGHNLINADSWLTRLGLSRDSVGRFILGMPILGRSGLVRRMRRTKAPRVDMKESPAYYRTLYGQTGAIYINHPEGSSEYQDLRQRLMNQVLEITDPDTGQPVVQQVRKGEDCFFGPHVSNVPAIVTVLHPDYEGTDRLSSYSSPVTKIRETINPGDHKMEGILIMAGSLIQASKGALPDLSLMDVAPTILHLLGLPIPSDLDGQVISRAFVPGSAVSRPASRAEPLGIWKGLEDHQSEDEEMSDEDESRLRERLAALGYLG